MGNFVTDRCSSRVLAPPGGGSSIVFGDASPAAPARAAAPAAAPAAIPAQTNRPYATAPEPAAAAPAAAAPPGALSAGINARPDNNYSRPSGQNVGNFLTDKPSTKVMAAPGGNSQIIFG